MHQLRTDLVDTDFLARVRRQQRNGYQLCYLAEAGVVRSVAGFRLLENLANGLVLYVDDLVTDADSRSTGLGQKLLEWLLRRAESAGCDTLELDSGVQRFEAPLLPSQSDADRKPSFPAEPEPLGECRKDYKKQDGKSCPSGQPFRSRT
jgi:GNAT superfamily N-acetyltransferase